MSKIYALYFSPTGNVKKIVLRAAGTLAAATGAEIADIEYTKPENRHQAYPMTAKDLLVIGMPVYAGRIPNKILPDLLADLSGCNTPAIAFTAFGNRNEDQALKELTQLLKNRGFQVVGGAAVVTEHAFSTALAPGRPDAKDLESIDSYVRERRDAGFVPVHIDESPVGPYYTPLKEDHTPAKFLKAKPETDYEKCTGCNRCVHACPMGSIAENGKRVTGICIKCQACIQVCPEGAKGFTDEDFLAHVRMLKAEHAERKEHRFLGE